MPESTLVLAADCQYNQIVIYRYQRKVLFGVFLPKKKYYYDLTKHNHNFQESVSEWCPCLIKGSGIFWKNPLKSTSEKVEF